MERDNTKLVFNTTLQRWEGKTGLAFIWMDNPTFQRYVDTYVEGNRNRIILSDLKETPITRDVAIEHCKRLAYWDGGRYDRNVHLMQLEEGARLHG